MPFIHWLAVQLARRLAQPPEKKKERKKTNGLNILSQPIVLQKKKKNHLAGNIPNDGECSRKWQSKRKKKKEAPEPLKLVSM